MTGPTYPNVLRFLDIPTTAALATERSKVVIYAQDKTSWGAVARNAQTQGHPQNFQIREPVD